MGNLTIDFYVGADRPTAQHVGAAAALIVPAKGDLVELRRGQKASILLPVAQVKHVISDQGHKVEVLLVDVTAEDAAEVSVSINELEGR